MATYEIQPNTEATPIVYKNGLVSLYVKFIKDDLTESAVQYYEVSVGQEFTDDLNISFVKESLQKAADGYNEMSVVTDGEKASLISGLLS